MEQEQKKKIKKGPGPQTTELDTGEATEAKTVDLTDILGDIDQILDQTAKVTRERSCCRTVETKKW